ncbi:MAG: BMP family protein [Armatimonadota bacterium]
MHPISGRRRLLAALAVGTLALAAGCAQNEAPANTPNPGPAAAPAAGTLKVGLITPGKITDGGWCQSANDGLERIKSELGAETVPAVENPAPAELAAAARNLAQGGANLVFFHGAEYDKAIPAVAKDFAGTTFVVVGGKEVSANLVPIQFAEREAGYIAGMVAAGMSKTHKVAAVGGTKIAIIESSFDAFKAGAKAADPNCDVKIVFTGSFEDQGKAKQQTQALIESGVDVVMHNANEAGKGVAQAVEESKGALFIGANSDQSDLATKRNLGSFIIDSAAAYVAVAKAVKEGTAAGKPFKGGIAAKAVYFKFNDKFEGTVPEAVRTKVAESEAAIAAGTVKP